MDEQLEREVVPAPESQFAAERIQDAHLALRYMVTRMLREPFAGTFQIQGGWPAFIAGSPVEARGRQYDEAMQAAWRAWGAEVGPAALGYEPLVPYESIFVAARMPASKVRDAQEQIDGMLEACAEVVRVMICGAIIAAKDGGHLVVVVPQGPFECIAQTLFEADAVQAAARARVVVLRAAAGNNVDVSRSYVLGSEAGKPRRQFRWAFPVAELVYGDQRPRWLDQRSPGHLLEEQIVVAGRPS